jgi:hypothetical protein
MSNMDNVYIMIRAFFIRLDTHHMNKFYIHINKSKHNRLDSLQLVS